MDNNVCVQVKKLLEVDRRAVELQGRRERELAELEQSYREEAERLSQCLQSAREDARKNYDASIQQAHIEAEEITQQTDRRLLTIKEKLDQDIEAMAQAWWEKILNGIR